MRIIFKDGTGSVSLKYLSEDTDRHGNVRVYFRKRGHRRVRLRQVPGTEAFMAEYKAALSGPPSPPPSAAKILPGSLRWLATEYYKSPEFKRLDGATQTIRRRMLDAIMPKWGGGRIQELRPKYVRMIRDEKAETPHAADNLLKALRVMFGWAIEAEHMESNPARDLSKVAGPSDGHHTWTIGEIETFLKRHPAETKAGLALSLLLYLGVRRSDVVRLGKGMENGEWLRLIEKKGDSRQMKVRDLPILPALRQVLNRHKFGHLTYLVTGYQRPFTANGFGNWFRDRCDEAGLTHCSAHGLRKAGATLAAENGATEMQLMALFGWQSPSQAAHYTKRANRKKLAAESAHKMNIGVAPSVRVARGATKRAKNAL